MKSLIRKSLCLASLCALLGCGGEKSAEMKLVTEATFPPYEFLQGNEVVGIDIEIVKAVAAKVGQKLVVDNVLFDSVIPSIISGKADIAAAGITVTPDRQKNVDFSIPYVTTGIVFVYKKDKPVLKGEEAKGLRIGVQNGTTSDAYVVNQLGQEPERFDSPAMAVAALKSGRVDCVLADVDPAHNCVKGEANLACSDFVTTEDYALAVRKGNAELLKIANETIAELKASGQINAWIKTWTAVADTLKNK